MIPTRQGCDRKKTKMPMPGFDQDKDKTSSVTSVI